MPCSSNTGATCRVVSRGGAMIPSVAHDRIEFRLVRAQDQAYGPDEVDVVEVYINGSALTDLWSRCSGEGGQWMRAADVMWPSRRLWTTDPLPSGELGAGDRRTVLVCVDGLTGCGGATAKIRLDDHTVQWSDFCTVPEGKVVALGPFTFDRRLYEQAIGRVERDVR